MEMTSDNPTDRRRAAVRGRLTARSQYFRNLWAEYGPVELRQFDETPSRLLEVLDDPSEVTELTVLGFPIADECTARLTTLESAFVMTDSIIRGTCRTANFFCPHFRRTI